MQSDERRQAIAHQGETKYLSVRLAGYIVKAETGRVPVCTIYKESKRGFLVETDLR